MKVAKFQIRCVSVPLAEPHRTASGVVAASPLVLLTVTTDDPVQRRDHQHDLPGMVRHERLPSTLSMIGGNSSRFLDGVISDVDILEFAKIVGVIASTIRDVETNRHPPKSEHRNWIVLALAKLGVMASDESASTSQPIEDPT